MSTQQFQGKVEMLDDVELKGVTTCEGKINLNGNKGADAGAGTGGTGTIVQNSVTREGNIIKTKIVVDLTGLHNSGVANDLIGLDGTDGAYLTQITTAVNGTILGGFTTCLEAPATGAGTRTDIDIYVAENANGAYDDDFSALTNQAQAVNHGTLSLGTQGIVIPDVISNGEYLYLVGVNNDTSDGKQAYTAGRLLIELFGQAS
jgi:hypothetical protein